ARRLREREVGDRVREHVPRRGAGRAGRRHPDALGQDEGGADDHEAEACERGRLHARVTRRTSSTVVVPSMTLTRPAWRRVRMPWLWSNSSSSAVSGLVKMWSRSFVEVVAG